MRTPTNKPIKTNKPNQTASPAGSSQQHHIQTMAQVSEAARRLKQFILPAELEIIGNACQGAEGEFFRAKLVELANIIETMPVTYATDGQGEQAIAWLHYFTPTADFYIIERDHQRDQQQAFGLACVWEEELGYISINELLDAGAELDLYWTPKSLGQVKAERHIHY